MHADFDRELAAYFTDVEHLRQWFAQWLTAKELPRRLLIIYGVGGVGKSSLLRMFRLRCKSTHVPVALSSGDEERSTVDILARWAQELDANGVRLAAFTKTFNHYRRLQAHVEQEVSQVTERLALGAAKTMAETAASGVLSLGSVLGELGGMGAEALVEWLFSRGFKKPDVDLLLNPDEKLTADFLADVTKAAAKRRMVLMLDTLEQLTGLESWLQQVAHGLPPSVLMVMAGRSLPDWGRAWPTWMAQAHVEELKPMSEDDTRELVRRYYAVSQGGGEPPAEQVKAIIRFARGLPMVVTAAVELWVAYGMEDFRAVKPRVVADLVDWLLEGVPEQLVPALEAAAVLRWFNRSILRYVMEREDVRDMYKELRRFPFVRSRVEGLALHDAVREIIDENLRLHDPEHYRELHERAAEYFEARLQRATGEEAERLRSELLYHRIRADEETGILLFQDMAEELAHFGMVNRLRALLNDVNTYPLKRRNGKLWREYYSARVSHLEGRLENAKERYSKLLALEIKDPKLLAYTLIDYADVLRKFRKDVSAIQLLEKAFPLIPVDEKVVWGYHALAGAYRRTNKPADAWRVMEKIRDYCAQVGDQYGLLIALDKLEAFYASDENNLHEANRIRRQRFEVFSTLKSPSSYMEMLIRGNVGFARAMLSGRYHEVERDLKLALEIARNLEVTNIINIARDLGVVVSLQERYAEGEKYFGQSISVSNKYGAYLSRTEESIVVGFEGFAWMRRGLIEKALQRLTESLEEKKKAQDALGLPELYMWLGESIEVGVRLGKLSYDQLSVSDAYYRACISSARYIQSRRYFECGALVGLVRLKQTQGDYGTIVPTQADAEQTAQQYEYNDHLAALRLTQGNIVWDGHVPKWGNGFDAAFHYYQQALIYALRYNRFLLDEVLSGRPQGTPFRPIIPECLKRGPEGRRMLTALLYWWQTGRNDTGMPRSDTISPIPEGTSLLEAERIAREREPGDGLPQKSVAEQIETALRD